jgi:hypothetical protein
MVKRAVVVLGERMVKVISGMSSISLYVVGDL